MWWMINAAGERVFTVESEEEAKARYPINNATTTP